MLGTTALVLTGLGAAACHNPASDNGIASTDRGQANAGASPGPDASPKPVGDRQAWLRCLAEQGVQIVDGKPDFGTLPKSRQEPAAQACAHLDPNDDVPPRPATTAQVEAWRVWAQCMRDNGIDMGDPTGDGPPPPPSNGARSGSGGSQADFERAANACADKLPVREGR